MANIARNNNCRAQSSINTLYVGLLFVRLLVVTHECIAGMLNILRTACGCCDEWTMARYRDGQEKLFSDMGYGVRVGCADYELTI